MVARLAVVCADQESLQDVQQLPRPTVEQLLSARHGAAVVGACAVGDALMGTALMAATSDGKLHALWPASSQRANLVSAGFSSGLSLLSHTVYLKGSDLLCSEDRLPLLPERSTLA